MFKVLIDPIGGVTIQIKRKEFCITNPKAGWLDTFIQAKETAQKPKI